MFKFSRLILVTSLEIPVESGEFSFGPSRLVVKSPESIHAHTHTHTHTRTHTERESYFPIKHAS